MYMNHPGTLCDDDKMIEGKFKLIKNMPHFQKIRKKRLLGSNNAELEITEMPVSVRELPALESSIFCISRYLCCGFSHRLFGVFVVLA